MAEIVAGVILLAPGFVALKVFYLLGAQRRRSQWEWTTWSVIASLPITGAASLLRTSIPLASTTPDPWETALGLLLGVEFGALMASLWLYVRRSDSRLPEVLRMAFGASAWDEALEDAQRNARLIELIMDDGKRYLGDLRYGDRDDNEAEGWVYLAHPEVYEPALKKFRVANGTHGYLVHRDHIRRVRVHLSKMEPEHKPSSTATTTTGVAEGDPSQ